MDISLIKPIRSEAQHDAVLARIDEIFDPEPGTPEADEFEILVMLSVAYEKEQYGHEFDKPVNPIEALKFRLDQMGMKEDDLGKVIGDAALAEDILTGRKPLNSETMRVLDEQVKVSVEDFTAQNPTM